VSTTANESAGYTDYATNQHTDYATNQPVLCTIDKRCVIQPKSPIINGVCGERSTQGKKHTRKEAHKVRHLGHPVAYYMPSIGMPSIGMPSIGMPSIGMPSIQ